MESIIEHLKERIKELYKEKGELLSKIADVKDLLTEPPFPNTFYESAHDCLQHHEVTGQPLTDLERQLLIYASELEDILGGIEEGLS